VVFSHIATRGCAFGYFWVGGVKEYRIDTENKSEGVGDLTNGSEGVDDVIWERLIPVGGR